MCSSDLLFVNPSSWTIYADASDLAWGAVLTPSRTSATASATAPTPPTPTPTTGDCPRFVAEGPQPRVPGVTLLAEDIFAQGDRLREFSPGWCNPPWHLIPQVLRLIAHSPPGSRTILVCPDLRSKPWWPLFDSMASGRRRRVPKHMVRPIDPARNQIPGQCSLVCAVVSSPAIDGEERPGKRQRSS